MTAAAIATRTPVASRRTPTSVLGCAPARVALLGTGTVGTAVLARLAAWRGSPLGERLQLAHVANSRHVFRSASSDRDRREATAETASLEDVARALGIGGTRIVIDATASDAVAERQIGWLADGIHVVTACKLGQGTSLARWRAIREACAENGARYGDRATVGAGLPLLTSLRALQAGGDRIHSIAGVLSGSLAWLFDQYDGLRPFSGFVRQAREAGYTEPDPRDDLSGEDVRRKLLILARTAGVALDSAEVEVDSLVPPVLAALRTSEVDAALPQLDEPLRARYADACRRGERLRFVARFERGRARVGLESLPATHPLTGGAGTDNRVAIWSDRYRDQPLVIQGPGAGAEVTAAALLDDALEIASASAGR